MALSHKVGAGQALGHLVSLSLKVASATTREVSRAKSLARTPSYRSKQSTSDPDDSESLGLPMKGVLAARDLAKSKCPLVALSHKVASATRREGQSQICQAPSRSTGTVPPSRVTPSTASSELPIMKSMWTRLLLIRSFSPASATGWS